MLFKKNKWKELYKNLVLNREQEHCIFTYSISPLICSMFNHTSKEKLEKLGYVLTDKGYSVEGSDYITYSFNETVEYTFYVIYKTPNKKKYTHVKLESIYYPVDMNMNFEG